MRHIRRLLAILAVGALAWPVAVAHASGEAAIRDVDTSDFPVVGVTVSTSDQAPLGNGDVRVLENGVPVKVTGVDPLEGTGQTVDAVIAIDVSNSMAGKELETALAAAQTFVANVPESLSVGVVSFSSEPVVQSPITSDRASVQAAVASLSDSTSAGTALYQTVVVGAGMFGDAEQGAQHNLIILTDGKNTDDSTTLDQAIAAAREAGVTVHTISLAGSDSDEQLLGELAHKTGGGFTSITPDQLEAVYAGLAHELAHQYVVSYRSKAPYGVAVTISVELPDATVSTKFLTPSLTTLTGQDPATIGQVEQSLTTSNVAIGVVAGLVFFAFLNLLVLVGAFREQKRREKQLRSRLPADASPDWVDPNAPGGVPWLPQGISDAAERTLGSGRSASYLKQRLAQAGWNLRPGEFVALATAAVVVGAVVGYILVPPWGALLGLPAGIVPIVILSAAATKRLAAIQAQLADTLMVIASSLRAGHSFLQSLDTATKEIGEPAATEFGRTMSEIRFGRDVDEALDALVERLGSRDLEWTVTAIKIQRKIGGNLAEVLEGVSKTIRERETLRRQVKVLSAEGRISSYVLTVLPILLALYLTVVNPDYLRVLTTTTVGMYLLVGAGGLMVIGYLWMQKIVRLDDV